MSNKDNEVLIELENVKKASSSITEFVASESIKKSINEVIEADCEERSCDSALMGFIHEIRSVVANLGRAAKSLRAACKQGGLSMDTKTEVEREIRKVYLLLKFAAHSYAFLQSAGLLFSKEQALVSIGIRTYYSLANITELIAYIGANFQRQIAGVAGYKAELN